MSTSPHSCTTESPPDATDRAVLPRERSASETIGASAAAPARACRSSAAPASEYGSIIRARSSGTSSSGSSEAQPGASASAWRTFGIGEGSEAEPPR
ncbi:hypothetical protein [Nonomuraea fuscirosea]|uniref:hypothetical protein n=1 Tax=Nonomuraea fuscirosea TaxID=1291556 RepID=UPI0033ED94A2